MSPRTPLLAAALLALAMPAFAQAPAPQAPAAQAPAGPTPEQLKTIYEAARNQQGVFEYCQAAGHIEASTVALQTRIMANLPKPQDTSGGEAAYARGKAGAIVVGPQSVTLADAAKGQNTTEAALCQRMGDSVKQAGASLPPQ
ncbi:pore-forming ESAT-6 family protein [Roseomonas sp. USHLN139]|uniref:pore-forming ESAT-6 family protein n=1 Tax=Roseomonas sp. USHLN139 TaxID=3081298 RepID=UPI003B01A526